MAVIVILAIVARKAAEKERAEKEEAGWRNFLQFLSYVGRELDVATSHVVENLTLVSVEARAVSCQMEMEVVEVEEGEFVMETRRWADVEITAGSWTWPRFEVTTLIVPAWEYRSEREATEEEILSLMNLRREVRRDLGSGKTGGMTRASGSTRTT